MSLCSCPFNLFLDGLEVIIKDGGEEEGEELGDEEAADDAEAEGDAGLGHGAADAEGDGDASHEGANGGHEDGTEADEGGFDDGVIGLLPFVLDGVDGKVDHHDSVFQDDADEENEADE